MQTTVTQKHEYQKDQDTEDELELDPDRVPLLNYKLLLYLAVGAIVLLFIGASMTKGSIERGLIRAIGHTFGMN